MAYDIGPRIGIEGEKEYRTALNDINRNMKTLGTEMKVVASQFDKNDKSTESLTAKNEVLNKMIDTQKNKLTELQKGLAAAADKYGENDKVTQGWKQAVNKATAELNDMERELKNNTKIMNSTGEATKDLSKDFEKAGKSALTFGDVLQANILGDVIVTGIKKIASTIKDVAVEGIKYASDLQESQNVVDVTFKDSANVIDKWSKAAAAAYGLSELQAKKFNGTIGAMLTSMGVTDSEMINMSTTLSGLAADFGSFYNLDPEEAFNKIRGGISGETEGLKQLGINLSQTALEQNEYFKSLGKTWKELTEAEKAQVRYNELLAQGANATGDFSRTSGSFANQQKILNLQMQNIAGTVGSAILPTLTDLMQSLNNFVTNNQDMFAGIGDSIKSFVEGVIENGPMIISIITGIGTGFATWQVVSLVMGIVEAFKAWRVATEGMTIAQAALNAVQNANPIGIIITLIAALVAGLIVLWNTNEDFRKAVIGAWESVKETGMAVFGWLEKFFTKDIPKAFNTVVDFFKNNWKEILLFITNPIAGALAFLYKLNPKFREWVDGVWDTIVKTIKSIGDVDWLEVGKNIINGIAKGVSNAAKNLVGSVVDAAKRALNAAKSFLGIRSPSRVMRDEVGKMIGAGLAEGITDSTRQVEAAMAGINNKIVADGSVKLSSDKGANGSSRSTVEHTGVIRLEGVNNNKEVIAVVDLVMDQLRREVRG